MYLQATNILNALAIICVFLVSNVNFGEGSHAHTIHKNVIDGPILAQKIGGNRTIVVDINGNGDFKTVQAAIDSVPEGNSNWINIELSKGIFRSLVIHVLSVHYA